MAILSLMYAMDDPTKSGFIHSGTRFYIDGKRVSHAEYERAERTANRRDSFRTIRRGKRLLQFCEAHY